MIKLAKQGVIENAVREVEGDGTRKAVNGKTKRRRI